ncbi:MAG: T9SS type A sorting domain-containing protein [Bacteroidales bacterium]
MRVRFFPVLLVIFLTATSYLKAQDTIRIMQYNLMFYGLYTDFCTAANNNVNSKDQYLRTILGHYKPDIFAVNELGRGAHNLTRIRDNVLNIEGVDYFDYAEYTNTGNGWFANGLFYDTRKFGLRNEVIVSTLLRDINLYTLYYKSEDLEHGADTVFLTCIVAHLKAGNSATDQQTRTAMVNNALSYLQTHNYSGNILFMGDFNMKSSFEEAYQRMINNSNENIRFFDPINVSGQWGNNPAMAPYHTQSPRTGTHDCFVTGGLDDRYDFILATRPVIEGTHGLKYNQGSYRAMGQDGNRYNQSLISPPNHSEPPEVIQALYDMSDHLPVVMKLLTEQFTPIHEIVSWDQSVKVNNPVVSRLAIQIDNPELGSGVLRVFNTSGVLMLTHEWQNASSSQNLELDIGHFSAGMYFLVLDFGNGILVTRKVVKL